MNQHICTLMCHSVISCEAANILTFFISRRQERARKGLDAI